MNPDCTNIGKGVNRPSDNTIIPISPSNSNKAIAGLYQNTDRRTLIIDPIVDRGICGSDTVIIDRSFRGIDIRQCFIISGVFAVVIIMIVMSIIAFGFFLKVSTNLIPKTIS